MKKSLIAIAVAAAVTVPAIASAESTVYGRTHISLEQWTVGDADPVWGINGMSNRANSVGIKGSVDTNLMGLKAMYKIEAGMDMESGAAAGKTGAGLSKERDTWVGLGNKAMGTVRAGTIGSLFKGTEKMVDPMFTTPFEGRGTLGLTSGQAAGSGELKGRITNAIRYDSPSIAGAKVVVTHAINVKNENATEAGVVYKSGGIGAFFAYETAGTDTSAMKVGGNMSMSGVNLGVHYDMDTSKDATDNNLFVSAGYTVGATLFGVSYGMTTESVDKKLDDRSGWAAYAKHKLDKKAMIYVGYGSAAKNKQDSTDATKAVTTDYAVLAGGMSIKF